MRLYPVHVACNDPDSGAMANRAEMITLDFGGGVHFELVCQTVRPPTFRELGNYPRREIKLGRAKPYAIAKSQLWPGNWCWNAYWLEGLEAARLVHNLMADGRFTPDAGPTDAWEAWDAGNRPAFTRAWKLALYPPEPVQLVGSGAEARDQQD